MEDWIESIAEKQKTEYVKVRLRERRVEELRLELIDQIEMLVDRYFPNYEEQHNAPPGDMDHLGCQVARIFGHEPPN